MQPQQPAPPAPVAPQPGEPGHDPYEFIVNPARPARRPLLIGGNSPAFRVLAVVGGLFLLLIVFVILKGVLGGGGDSNKALLISVVQDQAELVHLSTDGAQNAVAQNVKNFAITTQLSVTSAQTDLTTYIKNNGIKVSPKQLALKQSASLDTQLTSAQAASTYDPTFTSVMRAQIATYQHDLQAAYAKTTGSKGRALLSADYTGAGLLLTQLGSPAS